MKLINVDAEVAKVEGVIERSPLDAREALATGQYQIATEEPVEEPNLEVKKVKK